MAKYQTVQERDGDWVGPQYSLVHGVRIASLLVDPNFGEDLERFQTRKDDVFVVSYPKSGTTWVREILWQIVYGGTTSDVHLGSRVFFLDAHPLLRAPERYVDPEQAQSEPVSKPVIDLLPSPRLMVSHLPYHVIPKGKDDSTACKYIYIARNPKDVAVSYYHFILPFYSQKTPQLTLEIFFKFFLQGKFAYNLWSDHVLGWWKQRDNPNVLFLKYEDMKKDLPCCVKAMAEFVGKPLTEEVIQRIVHQCSFGEMRKNPASYQVFPGNDDVRFLRKGEVGDWKNHLTPEMNDQIEKEFIEKMREHWLEFD